MRPTVLVALVLVLAGCAPTPAPIPTVEPNAIACSQLVTAVEGIPAEINNAENSLEAWDGVRAKFDTIGLRGEGAVAERVDHLVQHWPDAIDIVVWNDYVEFNSALTDIERACNAAGLDTEIPLLG